MQAVRRYPQTPDSHGGFPMFNLYLYSKHFIVEIQLQRLNPWKQMRQCNLFQSSGISASRLQPTEINSYLSFIWWNQEVNFKTEYEWEKSFCDNWSGLLDFTLAFYEGSLTRLLDINDGFLML